MRVDVPPARRRLKARPARCRRTGSLPPETGHSQAPLAATVAVEAGYPACGLGACRAAHLWHAPAEPPGTFRQAARKGQFSKGCEAGFTSWLQLQETITFGQTEAASQTRIGVGDCIEDGGRRARLRGDHP